MSVVSSFQWILSTCAIWSISLSHAQTIIKTAKLTPIQTYDKGARVLSSIQDAPPTQNGNEFSWDVNIQSQKGWQFVISLDPSFGFDAYQTSAISITLNGPTHSIGTDELLFGVTNNNANYFSMAIPITPNYKRQARVYPPTCNVLAMGDVAALPQFNRNCDVAGGSCSYWQPTVPLNRAQFPLTITFENDPIARTMHVSAITANFYKTQLTQCPFLSFDAQRGLKVYFAGNRPGDSFVIDSFDIISQIITPEPTNFPTLTPTGNPTLSPSANPTRSPSRNPTMSPSLFPTLTPTESPTQFPSAFPTNFPTRSPSLNPTLAPTQNPSGSPTQLPTKSPSKFPTYAPSFFPTQSPSLNPSTTPTQFPTRTPTDNPTDGPTKDPTPRPSFAPSIPPSYFPSVTPTNLPTLSPSGHPSVSPTRRPSLFPTRTPTNIPSTFPTPAPSNNPSLNPTRFPTHSPSFGPSTDPTFNPSASPTASTNNPSRAPSSAPTTAIPTASPTRAHPVGFRWGAHDQLCPTEQGANMQCQKPTDVVRDSNGVTICGDASDCCMCASIECAEPCQRVEIGTSGAFGVKDIEIRGNSVWKSVGAVIDCQGIESCRETAIYSSDIQSITCEGRRACKDALISVVDPKLNFFLDCVGRNACNGLRIEVNITGPPDGYKCNPALAGQLLPFSRISCKAEGSCENLQIVVNNDGCEKLMIESLQCLGTASCDFANFAFHGAHEIAECQCRGSCANANGLTKCFQNIEFKKCAQPMECANERLTLTNVKNDFWFECGGAASCKESEFVFAFNNDAAKIEPVLLLKGIKFGGENSALNSKIVFANEQSEVVTVERIECSGTESCTNTVFVTGYKVAIGEVDCAYGACNGCLVKTLESDAGIPCDPQQIGTIF